MTYIPQNESQRFFQESRLMILAANKLKEYPILMKQCSMLYHYSIELLLKGCDIWKNNRLLTVHDLCKLLKRVPFIDLNENELKQLRIINDYFNYRYPLSERIFEQMKATLGKNANEDISGILPLPTEVSTYDLEVAENLYTNILVAMPTELQQIYEEIGENIKNNRLLV
ncbi:TPA: hypothetical protein ACT9K3_001977 [Legionella pneumophila]